MNRLLAPFNPFNPQRHIDPYPLYQRARGGGPIFYNRLAQTWIVTGYEEAVEILRGPVSSIRRRTFEELSPYSQMKQANIDLMLSNMLMVDDPDHARLRKLVSRAFTPRSVIDLQPRIDELISDLIAELSDQHASRDRHASESVDVMACLANRLPIYIIGEYLGLARGRWDELKAFSDVVGKFVDPYTTFDPAEMDAALDGLRAMFDALATERTANPGDDLISALVHVEVDGQRLEREEIISMAVLLLLAGHDTTSDLIGNALVALARNPQERERLRQQPELAANAVDELLRYDTPIQVTDRTALESFTVAGITIPEGALILILIGAANRDPKRYDRPEELELNRDKPRPLSFGHGVHHCIGAALARMEAASLITAFVDAFPDYRVDEPCLEWKQSATFRGPTVLPVALGAKAPASC